MRFKKFVSFIGPVRSGHTLISQLLNCHKYISISSEFNPFRRILKNKDKEKVFDAILNCCENNYNLNKGGHDYKIENSLQLITEFSTVIGDSMTGLKHGRKLLDVENQEKLFEVIEIPIYWIAVYRNPFDVISSSALMNEQSIEKNIDYFIENINIVNALSENEKINKNLIHVYLEDLIEDSEIQLKFLVNFLGLRSSKAFTNTCKEIIFDNSNQGFYRDEWTDYEIEKVNEFIIDTKELHKYKD